MTAVQDLEVQALAGEITAWETTDVCTPVTVEVMCPSFVALLSRSGEGGSLCSEEASLEDPSSPSGPVASRGAATLRGTLKITFRPGVGLCFFFHLGGTWNNLHHPSGGSCFFFSPSGLEALCVRRAFEGGLSEPGSAGEVPRVWTLRETQRPLCGSEGGLWGVCPGLQATGRDDPL